MVFLLISTLGIPLALVVYLLIQIIRDPNKIDQYKSIVIAPLYKLGKWGARTYIGAKIAYQVTEFFNRHIIRNIANQIDVKVDINWVMSDEDPILKEDNTVIICMKKDKDQARNVLKAAEIAIPIITHKHLRTNIDSDVEQSIDLVTLRNLANRLGNHGRYAFKRYFLEPKTKGDVKISESFQRLVQIDNRGYFVPILLNELEYISDGIYVNGDTTDHTNEIIEFIDYLIQIANVEVGDEVKQWSYFSKVFNAGIILLANNEKMKTKGVKPYLDRVTTSLKQGHESVYILAEENSWEFLVRYENVLAENDRILIKGRYNVDGIIQNDPLRKSKVKIVLLRKIDVFVDNLFKEKLVASDIVIGKKIEGEVVDVSEKIAIVSVLGMDAFIKKNECSWGRISSCNEILTIGTRKDFIVKSIDENKLSIELSLRLEENDPWRILPRPDLGDIVSTKIYSMNTINYFSRDSLGREIIIPITELSWHGSTEQEISAILDEEVQVKIIEINNDNKIITGSIRQIDENPWPKLNEQIKPGTEYIGHVTEVTDFLIRVGLKEGINGIIHKEHLTKAGGVYTDFKNNIIVGQGIEVVVSRVFVAKKKIHLNLRM